MFHKNNQIFAKRKTQEQKKRRRLKSRIGSKSLSILALVRPLILLLVILFGYIIYTNGTTWLEKLDQTPLNSYAVTNQLQFTTDTDIRDALATGEPLKGYFGQDVKQIEERLTNIPWVHNVVVRKLWPNKLSLTIFEHQPIALWNDNKLLSNQGIVFSLPFDRINRIGFPVLYGPETEGKKVLAAWWKIKQDLIIRNLALKSVTIDKRGSWKISLSDGVELRLGRGDWLPKIDRFVKIFPQIQVPDGKIISYVDLRYKL